MLRRAVARKFRFCGTLLELVAGWPGVVAVPEELLGAKFGSRPFSAPCVTSRCLPSAMTGMGALDCDMMLSDGSPRAHRTGFLVLLGQENGGYLVVDF